MASIRYIKGIGPKRAAAFSGLGIEDTEELALYFPRKWHDRRLIAEEQSAPFVEKVPVVYGVVESSRDTFSAGGLRIFKAGVRSRQGVTEAVFFKRNSRRFDVFAQLRRDFSIGSRVWLTGDCEDPLFMSKMHVGEYYTDGDTSAIKMHINRIVPVYRLTEGITAKFMFQKCRALCPDGL